MNILVYARNLSDACGGVKNYTGSMLRALARLDRVNRIHVVHNAGDRLFPEHDRIIEHVMESKNRVYCDYFLGPAIFKRISYDVVWYPHNILVGRPNKNSVVTIHDLAYFLPELNAYRMLDSLYMRRQIIRSCKHATKVIADSRSTRSDIERFSGLPAENVEVVALAADPMFTPRQGPIDENLVVNGQRIPQSFILYVGGLNPRKNVATLVRAFQSMQSEKTALVLTGAPSASWRSHETLGLIQSDPRIIMLGLVDERDLVRLYQHARLFVYPSLYEGFGLPILEAQACGCPVVTYSNSSLPEVAGHNSAHIVGDTTIESLTRALQLVHDSETYSQNLVRNGYSNVSKYSWDSSAEQLASVFAGVITH